MHHPAGGVKDLPQVVAPLRCVRTHEGQIGGDEGPLFVTNVTRIGFAGKRYIRVRVRHIRMLPPPRHRVHNTL